MAVDWMRLPLWLPRRKAAFAQATGSWVKRTARQVAVFLAAGEPVRVRNSLLFVPMWVWGRTRGKELRALATDYTDFADYGLWRGGAIVAVGRVLRGG